MAHLLGGECGWFGEQFAGSGETVIVSKIKVDLEKTRHWIKYSQISFDHIQT